MEERFELFTALITKISRSIKKIKNQEVEEYGLRSPHVSCLYYLYITDGLTATELCERCEEDKATVSRSLDYLETNGYILCESKSAKRYKSPLYLTEQGRMVAAKVAAKISRVLDDVSAAMTEEERVAFYRSLAMISDSLEACIKSDRGQ